MSRVIKRDNGCWEWTAFLNHAGYGQVGFNKKIWLAHRLSWVAHNKKPIPDGLYVCHSCDNPKCINPDHLWVGTNSDNIFDASRKGRMPLHNKTHCLRGHEYSTENTYVYFVGKKRKRTCKACNRIHNRATKARIKAKNSIDA